jgi:HD-GYP domain-containing protein (c-di-GMP phosphodiesterase class II)
VEILHPIITEEEILSAVQFHHEHWNGGGYPTGISRKRIPLLSRIICVADAFEAMTSDRPYRPAMSTALALEELKSGAKRQFDPEIVEVLINKYEDFHSKFFF